MIPTFTHDVNNSFFLWFDNYLANQISGHRTYTTKFYCYKDDTIGSGVVYGSPYKQWVYDHNVAGATIPSGLTIDGVFTPTGTSGLIFDFQNGRAIFQNTGVSSGLAITGTYTVKEYNTYITDETEETLLVENKYQTNSRFTVTENAVTPYDCATPAIFISAESVTNKGFAMGGMDETTVVMKGVVFAESLFQLDGALSACADAAQRCFKLIPMTAHPLAEFMNLKTGSYPTGYDYVNTSNQYTNKIFIYDVTTSKMRDSVSKELHPKLNIGFIDFDLGNMRYPRS